MYNFLFICVIDISFENGKIHEFFEFTKDVHKMISCDKTDCEIFKFLKPLEEVVFDPEKYDYDHQRTCFIGQCMKHPDVFGSMLQLKTKKNVKAVVEGLKKRTLEQLDEQKKNIEYQIEELIDKINSSSN